MSFQKGIVLDVQKPLLVKMYHGVLMGTGTLQIHFGYRLTDGTLVSSAKAIEVFVVGGD